MLDTLSQREFAHLQGVLSSGGAHTAYWAALRSHAGKIYAQAAATKNFKSLQVGLKRLKGNTTFGSQSLVDSAKFVVESAPKVRFSGTAVYVTVRGHFNLVGSRSVTEPTGVYHVMLYKGANGYGIGNERVTGYNPS